MKTIAIIPVKRLDEAKQRLTGSFDGKQRADLVAAMAADVLDSLSQCERISQILVVSSEPAIATLAAERDLELIDDPGGLGHSGAATLGVARAIELGADCAALLPGDCPLVHPGEIGAAVDHMEPQTVSIIPDRHGRGTNGLLIAPPDGIKPAFGEESRLRHTNLAKGAGLTPRIVQIPSLALDLDTPDDFESLRDALAADPGRAPATVAAVAALSG